MSSTSSVRGQPSIQRSAQTKNDETTNAQACGGLLVLVTVIAIPVIFIVLGRFGLNGAVSMLRPGAITMVALGSLALPSALWWITHTCKQAFNRSS